jgi:hypothetical protein
MGRRTYGTEVELLGIPRYTQGDHDSLCTYYACTMMLETIFPEARLLFGKGRIQPGPASLSIEDPVFAEHSDYRNASNRYYLTSRWFFDGMQISDALKAMNRYAFEVAKVNDLFFVQEDRTFSDKSFNRIKESIDKGLPILMGWWSTEFGEHTVVVSGYRESPDKFLLLRDPGSMKEVSWERLQKTRTDRFDLAFVDATVFDKLGRPRPDKSTTVRPLNDAYGATRRVERYWWAPDGLAGWYEVSSLFRMVRNYYVESKKTLRHRVLEELRQSTEGLRSVDLQKRLDVTGEELTDVLEELLLLGQIESQGQTIGMRYFASAA